MIELLENITARVECVDKIGTAFLISKSVAMTAFHVVRDNPQDILLTFKNGTTLKATVHELIDDEYKTKDIALLILEKSIADISLIDLCCADIHVKDIWVSRGFPAGKMSGENIFGTGNVVQQVHSNLKDGKYNIELNHENKFDSYSGVSGAPVVIYNTIVGIINSELTQKGTTRELMALSSIHFKDLTTRCGIEMRESYPDEHSLKDDVIGATLFDQTKPSDIRALREKLRAVYEDISEHRLNKYCRDVATGIEETQRHNPHQIQSMKYRIFEACQDVLIGFIESRSESKLSQQEIDNLLESFTMKAEEIIIDKSKDYHYPLTNRDILRKMVLDLIDTCYLSFDEEGIYDE